jgi:hypothetical protein
VPSVDLAQQADVIWHWIGQDAVPVGDEADLLLALEEAK